MPFDDKVSEVIKNAEDKISSTREELRVYVVAIERYDGNDLCVLGELISKATALKHELEGRMAFAANYYGKKNQCIRDMTVGYYQAEA